MYRFLIGGGNIYMSRHRVTRFYRGRLNTVLVRDVVTSGYIPERKSVTASSDSRVEIVAPVVGAGVVAGGGVGV